MAYGKPISQFFTAMLFAFVILTCLSVFLSVWILDFVSIPFFIVLCVFNFSLSFSIIQVLFTRRWGMDDPPRLDSLPSRPRVAILYLTCDDLNEACIRDLGRQSYEATDVFILDDSTCEESKLAIDALSGVYRIVRRPDRSGKKAGNLNHWLRLHGEEYSFFAILDNDSLVGADFVDTMLRYALHPENSQTAVFQSLMEIWNRESLLAATINAEKERGNRIASSLYNKLGFYFGWGHNALFRTSTLIECGGFAESFVAEDLELGLRLMERGYDLKIVNILSYEGIAKDIFRYSIREGRICQSNLQALTAKRWAIPPSSYFFLVVLNLNSLSVLLIMALNVAIMFNAAVVAFGPLYALMYLEYYSSDYFIYNIAMFALYLMLPIMVDVLALPPRSGFIHGIACKLRLVAYNISLNTYLFARVVEFIPRKRVSFHVTNAREKPRGRLIGQYAFSSAFYFLFPIMICLVYRGMFYPFSIWFIAFIAFSLLSLHLGLDSLKRRGS